MLDAVEELKNLGLLEERQGSFWTVTPEGRAFAADPIPLWRQLCSVTLEPDEQRILKVVNALGAKVGSDPPHAWLEMVDREPLLKEYGITAGMDMQEVLWPVSEDLERRGLVHRDANIGWHLDLKPTYAGLVWETRRGMLRKCDVFISHSTEESAAAKNLQEFLQEELGKDLKVFVSSDYRSISGGKLWLNELLEAIKSAPVTLVLLSGDSAIKPWINFEAGIGIGADNLVIPLALPGLSKSEVGHPLSAFQVRSLDDVKDVEGMLDDVGARTDRTAAARNVETFVSKGYATGGGKLETTLNQVPGRPFDGYKQHDLIVGIVNNSSKTIQEFRVEVELPNAITNQSTTYGVEVQERRTPTTRYFRIEGKNHNIQALYPSDRRSEFFRIDLIIPPDAEEGGALEQKIVVKVFAGDAMTQKIEKTVREVLAQTPSFG